MQKHSPEPWNILTPAYRQNWERAIACVNALAGIEDPAQWVGKAKLAVDRRCGRVELGYRCNCSDCEYAMRVRELVEAAKIGHTDNDGVICGQTHPCRTCAAIQKFDPTWGKNR